MSQSQRQRHPSAPGRASFSREGSKATCSPPLPSSGSNIDAPNESVRDEDEEDDGAEDIMAWTTSPWHLAAPSSEPSSNLPAAIVGTDNAQDHSSIHVAYPGVGAGHAGGSASADSAMPSVSCCDDYGLAEPDTDLAEFLLVQSPESHMAAASGAEQGPGLPGADATFAKAQQMSPMSLGLQPRNEVDSQCCIECCQLINDLENYIMAELRTVQQGSRNKRCMVLFTALLYQVYELLEACFTTVMQEKDRQLGSRGLTGALPNSLGFGFGDLSAIDAEEQAGLRTRSVLREVQQASEVLRKLKARATVEPEAD
ncbi:hypothetical protein diail_10854, partial [Diaporthe ilicicola]